MSEYAIISSDIWHDPSFKNESATMRGAFIWLASMGRIVRVTIADLSEAWGVTDRRAAQMVHKMESRGLISVQGAGRCRLICIESKLAQSCGFFVGARAKYPRGPGAAKWRANSLPQKVRSAVLDRDSHTCRYCGAKGVDMHVDHIKPVALGGKDNLGNLAASCVPCNLSKGKKTLSEWRGPQ